MRRYSSGETRIFKGYRVQHNKVMAPSKGGMRYQESVTLDELRRIRRRFTHALGSRIGPSHDIAALALESLATSYAGRANFPRIIWNFWTRRGTAPSPLRLDNWGLGKHSDPSMIPQAVFEGTIPEDGVGDLLGGLEEIRTTGVLTFQSELGSGTVRLVQGQVADAETSADEERALQVLLTLREGEFAVYPKLPHLPVSRGTDTTRRGSLAVHPPADLMRYCEGAGLTGRLLLEHRGRLAIAYYEKGELQDVSIDGGTAADYVLALEWTEGTFRVDAVPPPRETLPPALRDKASTAPPKNPTALPLLDAFEEGLADLGRVDATPVSGQGPRLEDLDEDATIRIIRRPGEDDLPDLRRSWHALDYSPSFATESATTSTVKSKDDGRPIGFLRTLGWVGAVFLVVTACLWLLASLPPLE